MREVDPKTMKSRPREHHPKVPKVRFNMRMPQDIRDWGKEHAHAQGTTLSAIIVQYLNRLKRRVERENNA
tara:strand:+ start:635 stop:844 length:210 start_codon:yes stop_codon:yes gene_type:complete